MENTPPEEVKKGFQGIWMLGKNTYFYRRFSLTRSTLSKPRRFNPFSALACRPSIEISPFQILSPNNDALAWYEKLLPKPIPHVKHRPKPSFDEQQSDLKMTSAHEKANTGCRR